MIHNSNIQRFLTSLSLEFSFKRAMNWNDFFHKHHRNRAIKSSATNNVRNLLLQYNPSLLFSSANILPANDQGFMMTQYTCIQILNMDIYQFDSTAVNGKDHPNAPVTPPELYRLPAKCTRSFPLKASTLVGTRILPSEWFPSCPRSPLPHASTCNCILFTSLRDKLGYLPIVDDLLSGSGMSPNPTLYRHDTVYFCDTSPQPVVGCCPQY